MNRRIPTILAATLLATLPAGKALTDVPKAALDRPHTVIELRQYTLHPHRRDVLIDIFDHDFLEGQEVQGMRIIGEFRDLDHRDHFVWLRSFTDMEVRAEALKGFYGGPVWRKHRKAANATMVDSDNVLLLEPVRSDTGFALPDKPRPPMDASGFGKGLFVASIVYLRPSLPGRFEEFFEDELRPQLQKAGATIIAELATKHAKNNFPSLPIRENENVFVWFSAFKDPAAFDALRRALASSPQWRELVTQLSLWTYQPIQKLRLQPTARSSLQVG